MKNLFILQDKEAENIPRPLIFQPSPSETLPELAPPIAFDLPVAPDEEGRPRSRLPRLHRAGPSASLDKSATVAIRLARIIALAHVTVNIGRWPVLRQEVW